MNFSLLDQPWIPVRMRDGSHREMGLLELFSRAHDIADLMDSCPTATMALHRILLAILYRSSAPKDQGDWVRLWRREVFDERPIQYLKEQAERFDLFHPDRPFLQDPKIASGNAAYSLLKLWHLGVDSSTFFSKSRWEEPHPYSPGLAARMMLATQSFARCGLYSKLEGEANSTVAGPLTDITSVLIIGASLFETLMLNTPAEDFLRKIFPESQNDLPAWELEGAPTLGMAPLQGYLDLLTRPIRRILLAPETAADGRLVVPRATVMRGLEFPVEGRPLTEVMAPYKIVDGQPAQFIRWSPEALAWQNSHVLFHAFDDADSAIFIETKPQEGEKKWKNTKARKIVTIQYRPSKTVEWLSLLAQSGKLDPAKRFRIAVFGTSGDKGKIDFWRQEFLPLRTPFLTDPELFDAVKEAIQAARTVTQLLRWAVKTGLNEVFDFGIKTQNGVSARKALLVLSEVIRKFMASLDLPFREFLESLSSQEPKPTVRAWRKRLKMHATEFSDTELDILGSGMRGAMIKGSVGKRLKGALRKFMADDLKEITA